MSATLSLFPLLGRTPPPWRWPADVMATAIATHIAYVAAVGSVDDAIGPDRPLSLVSQPCVIGPRRAFADVGKRPRRSLAPGTWSGWGTRRRNSS